MSHTAEKCKRGDPSGFINIYSVAKYRKTRKGDFQITIVAKHQKMEGGPSGEFFSKKSRTVPKKIKKGDPLASAGFVGYVKKVKKK